MKEFLMLFVEFSVLACNALLHPESPKEWRFAYAYFVIPFLIRPGFALIVTGLILYWFPHPLDFILALFFCFYLFGEFVLYYSVYDGFARQWDHWVETGVWI